MKRYRVEVAWSFGASSSVPTAEVSVEWKGQTIECPFYFGGITGAEMRMRDFDGDHIPDLVFGDGKTEIVVGFLPGRMGAKPSFHLLKDNTGRGFNE